MLRRCGLVLDWHLVSIYSLHKNSGKEVSIQKLFNQETRAAMSSDYLSEYVVTSHWILIQSNELYVLSQQLQCGGFERYGHCRASHTGYVIHLSEVGFVRPTCLAFKKNRKESRSSHDRMSSSSTAAEGHSALLSRARSPHRWRCCGGRVMVAKPKAGCCDFPFLHHAQTDSTCEQCLCVCVHVWVTSAPAEWAPLKALFSYLVQK